MIVFACSVFGAVTGVLTAKRRKGNVLDMLQYGAGFAIAFAILGIFLVILLQWVVG